MKKIYILIFAVLSSVAWSQPYSHLLQSTDWTIMKINWYGTDYYPPESFKESGKVIFNAQNNTFESRFFNYCTGQLTFGPNNAAYFQLQNLVRSYIDIWDPGLQEMRDFDNIVMDFYYPSQPLDRFYFEYNEVSAGRNLVVTNPAGHKIFYSNLVLGSSGVLTSDKCGTIYPNPAKNEFYIKPAKNALGKMNVEIFDATGKLVSTQKISGSEAVDTHALPNGVYVVKALGRDTNYSTKLLIKK